MNAPLRTQQLKKAYNTIYLKTTSSLTSSFTLVQMQSKPFAIEFGICLQIYFKTKWGSNGRVAEKWAFISIINFIVKINLRKREKIRLAINTLKFSSHENVCWNDYILTMTKCQ